MPLNHHGIRLFSWIFLVTLFQSGITLNSLPDSNSCTNISINNLPFGVIHSLNFYSGQSQPPNTSCSWTITNSPTSLWSNYILSLRVIELENDPTHWSNELSFWTGNRQISIDDISNRTFFISSSTSSVQIFFRTKAPLLQTFNPYIRTNLRVRRFLIEFIHVTNDITIVNNENSVSCLSTGILIPKQWKCNCLSECSSDDRSDELSCPLCSMYELSNGLLCQSNEFWCLPNTSKSLNENLIDVDYDQDDWMQSHITYSRKIDPKGVCVPHSQYQSCSYSTQSSHCEKVLVWRRDHGQILIDNALLNAYQTLCFVIIAKDEYKIKLFLNDYHFIEQRSNLELNVYDGSEDENQILVSSNWFLRKEIVQTRENHIATIVIRQHSVQSITDRHDQDVVGYLEMNETGRHRQRREIDSVLMNITWITSICPDDQMLCGGHFETKCYTKEQRCDGIWDCINGDDELGCSPESCPTTFTCNDRLRLPSDQPRCFTWSERCNGNAFCANRTDEKFCTSWWCNSNNGTFLCKNLNCIYETWVCDGTDDCGDHSDETNCPSRVPRRIVTAAVIGATVCSTLFIIALGCTCKLFHLRSAERRAASRLLNPQRYIEERRQQIQREQQRRVSRQNRHHTSVPPTPPPDNVSVISNEARRIAPPSYNQTMGLMDENEERHAALAEHLRLAGLANYIALPPLQNNSRSSRSTSRHRHRRHRRHRHHRRAHSEGSRVALLEPTVVVPNNNFSVPSTSFSFNRFRSQLRALFTPNQTTSTTTNDHHNSIQSNPLDTYERQNRLVSTPTRPIVVTTRSHLNSDFIQSRELPPPYTEEQLVPSNPAINSLSTTMINSRRSSSGGSDLESTNPTTTTSTSLYRRHKRQIPINTLRDRMRQFISGAAIRDDFNHPMQATTTIDLEEQPPVASIEDDEQPSSDDDKMLTP